MNNFSSDIEPSARAKPIITSSSCVLSITILYIKIGLFDKFSQTIVQLFLIFHYNYFFTVPRNHAVITIFCALCPPIKKNPLNKLPIQLFVAPLAHIRTGRVLILLVSADDAI